MTFRRWTHTLEDYASAFEQAGLATDALREPQPTSAPAYERWRAVPLFLFLRAVKS